MSLGNFIPQIWTAATLRYLDKAHVFAQNGVVNRDYEGEISAYGDVVKINQVGPITIGTYTKDTDMSAAQSLTGDQTNLVIDKSDYFHFEIDDIDKAQTKPKLMNTAMQRAAYGLSDASDIYVADAMAAGTSAANVIATVSDLGTAANAYLHILRIQALLDEANVPRAGRWLIMPPWYHEILMQDVTRFASGYSEAGQAALRNGYMGSIDGLTIMASNNTHIWSGTRAAAASVDTLQAGVDWAYSYAEQIAEVEAYRPPLRFADALKGLHVYGGKVVLPASLALCKITHP
jgi:hypothetical protein